jgi:hypothetical protein
VTSRSDQQPALRREGGEKKEKEKVRILEL